MGDGETVAIVLPPRAEAAIDHDLIRLVEHLVTHASAVEREAMDYTPGFLGGPYGYGVQFANAVFELWPDYQDAECTCGFHAAWEAEGEIDHDAGCMGRCTCSRQSAVAERAARLSRGPDGHDARCDLTRPNFQHVASGLEIRWYKWIGRDMRLNRAVAPDEWRGIIDACFASLGA